MLCSAVQLVSLLSPVCVPKKASKAIVTTPDPDNDTNKKVFTGSYLHKYGAKSLSRVTDRAEHTSKAFYRGPARVSAGAGLRETNKIVIFCRRRRRRRWRPFFGVFLFLHGLSGGPSLKQTKHCAGNKS